MENIPLHIAAEMSLTALVKDRTCTIDGIRAGYVWYVTDAGFEFPVPFEDIGSTEFPLTAKATVFMKWIRRRREQAIAMTELSAITQEMEEQERKHDSA